MQVCSMTLQHILLTALGREQRSTVYELHGSTVEEPLAPLALLRLLPQDARPNRVLALCTEGARHATWETFANGVRQTLHIEAERLGIPDGKTADEIRQIVETAAAKFPEGAELTLDVTQGLRHFPFVAYALALYLTSLRGIRLRGAYYGMLEAFAPDSKEPRPIVDIRPLLDLPEWFHAVRVFRETGSTGPLAGLMRTLQSGSPGNADAIVTSLEKMTFAYEAGLPVELAYAAARVASSFAKGLPTAATTRIPLATQVSQLLTDACHMFQTGAVDQDTVPTTQEAEWKSHIAADDDELRRQANLIDLYLFRNQLPLALGMMREWVVSLLLARAGRGAKWLDGSWNGTRSIAERRLGALAALQRDKTGRTASGITLTSSFQDFLY
jgi:CRISPR-associated DxTHG motif protein